MKPTEGTPSNLRQAIINGVGEALEDERSDFNFESEAFNKEVDAIQNHVADFLSQKLAWASMKAGQIHDQNPSDHSEGLIKELAKKLGFEIGG